MSQVFFNELGIPTPDYNLDISNASHGAMTGRMLEKIEDVLVEVKPDWVLIYGDTNSTLAGTLASKKLHLKVAYIESLAYIVMTPPMPHRILKLAEVR